MYRSTVNLLILLAMLMGFGCARGELILVPSPNYPTIASALAQAAITPGSDEIVIAADEDPYLEYDLDLVSDVVIRSATGNPEDVVINADIDGDDIGEGRVFITQAGGVDNLTIRDLTITNGYGESVDGTSINGAGVCIEEGSNISFERVRFIKNVVEHYYSISHDTYYGGQGGGLYVLNSDEVTITSCYFTLCTASRAGGGVFAEDSRLTVTGTETYPTEFFDNYCYAWT